MQYYHSVRDKSINQSKLASWPCTGAFAQSSSGQSQFVGSTPLTKLDWDIWQASYVTFLCAGNVHSFKTVSNPEISLCHCSPSAIDNILSKL
jgi:hypothetical protein